MNKNKSNLLLAMSVVIIATGCSTSNNIIVDDDFLDFDKTGWSLYNDAISNDEADSQIYINTKSKEIMVLQSYSYSYDITKKYIINELPSDCVDGSNTIISEDNIETVWVTECPTIKGETSPYYAINKFINPKYQQSGKYFASLVVREKPTNIEKDRYLKTIHTVNIKKLTK